MDLFLVCRVNIRMSYQKIVQRRSTTFLGTNDQKVGQSAAGAFEDGLETGNAWDVLVHKSRSGGMGVGMWLRA